MSGRVCENVINGRQCGGPYFSWSLDHGNKVLCSACYEDWKANRKVVAAREAFAGLSAAEKKKLLEVG